MQFLSRSRHRGKQEAAGWEAVVRAALGATRRQDRESPALVERGEGTWSSRLEIRWDSSQGHGDSQGNGGSWGDEFSPDSLVNKSKRPRIRTVRGSGWHIPALFAVRVSIYAVFPFFFFLGGYGNEELLD